MAPPWPIKAILQSGIRLKKKNLRTKIVQAR